MKKYFPIIILSAILLFTLAGIAHGYQTIVQDYPTLPACESGAPCKPGSEDFGLPEFIKYLYLLSIGLVGAVGFVAIIIAAFDYTLSVGNPQKAAAGKDKLLSAILGIILLLGSVILLNFVNPDLLKFKKEIAKPVKIETEGGQEETGCRYTGGFWEPSVLDAGESATLTLYRKDCTLEEINNHSINTPIKQTVPGVSSDLSCEEIRSAGRYPIKTTKDYVSYKFTFNKKCNESTVGWNCKWLGIIYGGGIICNMQKDKPEQFYLTGTIKIPGKSTQYIGRVNIIVNDSR